MERLIEMRMGGEALEKIEAVEIRVHTLTHTNFRQRLASPRTKVSIRWLENIKTRKVKKLKNTTTPVSVLEKRKIADELENFFHEIKPKETKEFKDSEDANQFILCASVDYGIIAENAWQFYDLLKQRLGYFAINKVASMPKEQLERLIGKNPMIGQKALHRFPSQVAKIIQNNCKILLQEFSSDARKIWSGVYPENTPELIQRLYMFERIGHKKAHMIARVLVTEYGMNFDRRFIDVSEDRHVRRVFLRSGLVEKDDASIVIEVARWLRPKFPGILDLPTWTIAAAKKSGGREWCTPKSPKCTECRINDVCGKRIWLQEKGF